MCVHHRWNRFLPFRLHFHSLNSSFCVIISITVRVILSVEFAGANQFNSTAIIASALLSAMMMMTMKKPHHKHRHVVFLQSKWSIVGGSSWYGACLCTAIKRLCQKRNDEELPEQQQKRVWSTVCPHNHPACPLDSNCSNRNGQAMVQSCRSLQIQTTSLLWRVLMTCMRQKRMQSRFVCLVSPFAAKCNYFHVLASDQEPYAGLLMPDTTVDYCSIWLSSAIQPPSAESDKSRLARQDAFVGCCWREGSQG
jgi:hypothetical protein